eukprot:jgi/Botrbrau1/17392/Bobra.0709s0003.3
MVARVLLLSHRAKMTRARITSKRHNNSYMFEMVFSNYLSRETEDGWLKDQSGRRSGRRSFLRPDSREMGPGRERFNTVTINSWPELPGASMVCQAPVAMLPWHSLP